MKLVFKKIKIKNFMSVGAVPLELDYIKGIHAIVAKTNNSSDTTNGQGKSILGIDSLVFVLFGKSIRGLNLKEMVNNINGAECEVTLWFSLDGVNWRIERGINPDYLKIINEDEEKDKTEKEASAKKITQQKIDALLGISYTSFINSITLNINYSKPFFKLKLSEKRQILEDVLNIVIYGKMFEKTKREINALKEDKRVLESELNNIKELFNDKKETHSRIEDEKNKFEKNKFETIQKLNLEIESLKIKNTKLIEKIPTTNFEEIKTKLKEKKESITEKFYLSSNKYDNLISEIDRKKEEINNIKSKPICPLCKTLVESSEHTKIHIENLLKEINEKEEFITELLNEKNSFKQKNIEIKEKLIKLDEIIQKVDKIKNLSNDIKNEIVDKNRILKYEETKTFSLSSLITEDELNKIEIKLKLKEKNYNDVCKKIRYYDYMKELLGDHGIKKYIIKKVIPLLNKKTNEYLSLFKAKYSLTFDSDFNEKFKTRNREERTYNSFSAGQQKRIDLAFMFALLDVAKQQSSIDSNILILDEIIDSSICSNGIMQLINFLKIEFKKNYPDMCVYIISHKSEITEDNFNSIITVKMENDFTKIDSIKKIDQIIQV